MKPVLIPERLTELREALGITKLEASRRMHLTQSGYVRYESGERSPSFPTILVMAQALGTSAEYLTGATDNPEPTSILITKKYEPELFDLVSEIIQLPPEKKAALLTAFSKQS